MGENSLDVGNDVTRAFEKRHPSVFRSLSSGNGIKACGSDKSTYGNDGRGPPFSELIRPEVFAQGTRVATTASRAYNGETTLRGRYIPLSRVSSESLRRIDFV